MHEPVMLVGKVFEAGGEDASRGQLPLIPSRRTEPSPGKGGEEIGEGDKETERKEQTSESCRVLRMRRARVLEPARLPTVYGAHIAGG